MSVILMFNAIVFLAFSVSWNSDTIPQFIIKAFFTVLCLINLGGVIYHEDYRVSDVGTVIESRQTKNAP